MNYIQRIYDLLVEAQINEVGVYRNTSNDRAINQALQLRGYRSEYGIRTPRGDLMNVEDPRMESSYKRGSAIRAQQGLPPLPDPRTRAKALFQRRHRAGQTGITHQDLGPDSRLMSSKSRGHGMRGS